MHLIYWALNISPKVTPSSKVVGDLAQFTQSGHTLVDKVEALSFSSSFNPVLHVAAPPLNPLVPVAGDPSSKVVGDLVQSMVWSDMVQNSLDEHDASAP